MGTYIFIVAVVVETAMAVISIMTKSNQHKARSLA
jgi:hypothetical protein